MADFYVQLAKRTLEMYVTEQKVIATPTDTPQDLRQMKAGVFVSLKLNGALRGCIGTLAPTCENVALEIIQNAVSAGTSDPRFEPVRENELAHLSYSVDVLMPSQSIHSIDALDVKKYGVIVTHGSRRGLLLPDLEGVDSPEQQVDIALRKAGIGKHEAYTLERFEVIRHGQKE